MPVGLQEVNRYFALQIVTTIIIIVVPLFRLYVLWNTKRSPVRVASEIFFAFACALGWGLHLYDLKNASDERQIRKKNDSELLVEVELVTIPQLKYWFAETLLHVLQLWCIKAAFLLMYWDLTRHMTGRKGALVRWAVYGTAVVLVASFIAINAVFLTYCHPMSLNWDLLSILEHFICSPEWAFMPQTLWIVLTIISDLMILGIPIILIRLLQFTRIEKRVLPGIFLIGFLSIVAPLVRYVVNHAAGNYPNSPKQSFDLTLQSLHRVILLSYAEDVAAFLAFCLPSFRPVLAALVAKSTVLRRYLSDHSSRSGSWTPRKTHSKGSSGFQARKVDVSVDTYAGSSNVESYLNQDDIPLQSQHTTTSERTLED